MCNIACEVGEQSLYLDGHGLVYKLVIVLAVSPSIAIYNALAQILLGTPTTLALKVKPAPSDYFG